MTVATKVSKSHFKAHALELLRRVEATGEPLIITDRGRPVLEVRPYREEDPRETLRGTLLRYEAPTEPAGEVWGVLGRGKGATSWTPTPGSFTWRAPRPFL